MPLCWQINRVWGWGKGHEWSLAGPVLRRTTMGSESDMPHMSVLAKSNYCAT